MAKSEFSKIECISVIEEDNSLIAQIFEGNDGSIRILAKDGVVVEINKKDSSIEEPNY